MTNISENLVNWDENQTNENFLFLSATAVAEDCKSYVLTALPLASVLDCDKFPDSTDPTVCFSLATTSNFRR